MSFPISLIVIIRNAKDNLKKLIEYHRPYFKEIIVVDQSSTDGTFELAKEMADIAVQRRAKGYCEPDRNYACELANQPYVFLLDDDERLSKELLEEMPNLLKSNGDIFWFARKNFVDGHDIFEILGHDSQCRMSKKGALRWSDVMHQYPEAADSTKIFFVDSPIEHYRDFKTLKASNQKRNAVVQTKEQFDIQNNFVMGVENFLAKKAQNA